MTLFKHKNNTDVAIQVIKKFYVKESDSYKLRVRWFNIVNPDNIYYTGVQDNIRIPREVFAKDWDVYA